MTIPDLYGQITAQDLPDSDPALLRVLNRLQSTIQNLAVGGLSLADNAKCDIINGIFSHGVPTQVKLTKVKVPGSATVHGADGYFPISAAVTAGGAGGAAVTIIFSDPSAVNVQATVVIYPEGTKTRSAPTVPTTPPGIPPLVACRYHQTVAQVITTAGGFQVINYDTKDYDTDNAVTTGAAWKFTCPTAKGGKYHLNASYNAFCPAPFTELFFAMYLNGAESTVGACAASTNDPAVAQFRILGCISCDILLAPGNTLDVRILQNNTGANNMTTEPFTSARLSISVHSLQGGPF